MKVNSGIHVDELEPPDQCVASTLRKLPEDMTIDVQEDIHHLLNYRKRN